MSPQNISNLCVRCETKFARWNEYHAHVTGIPCSKVIRPLNTSGRTKEQIVTAWETAQKVGVLI